jgi:outer membrane lipoprotein-sorting protein
MRNFIVTLLLLSGFTCVTQAQTDVKAKTILAGVSKKYKSYSAVKADFSFTFYSPQAKVNETSNGTLYVKAAVNKYKVIMTDKEIISDGKNQWTYLKEDKEVQVNKIDNSEDDINPAKIFTMYEKGFKYIFTGESKIGSKVYQNIDLAPLDAKKSFFKIKLSIDKAAMQLSNVVIYDKNGSKYTYHVKAFVPNVKIPESTFSFDAKKFPGVEVVDLR